MPSLDTPQIPPEDRVHLRLSLVAEEFCELVEACDRGNSGTRAAMRQAIEVVLSEKLSKLQRKPNLPDVADALGDLDYVIEGMRQEFGIDGWPIAREIHRANMEKFGPGSCRREDGKVLKPPGWTPPDIEGELRKQGWKP